MNRPLDLQPERCSLCRFWLPDDDPNGACPVEGPSLGWCRREPPRVSDHMAAIAIGIPNFGGNQVDPEDIADIVAVHRSTLTPVTGLNDWCGRFEVAAAEAGQVVLKREGER